MGFLGAALIEFLLGRCEYLRYDGSLTRAVRLTIIRVLVCEGDLQPPVLGCRLGVSDQVITKMEVVLSNPKSTEGMTMQQRNGR